jgi:hypothetical protein
MSNKFLPFVTEKSSVDSIFKALIQRSKGLSDKKLSLVYSAILILGIDKIKNKVSTFPESLSSQKIIDEIANSYPEYEIPNYEVYFWQYILKFYGIERIKGFENYTFPELNVMFSCIISHSSNRLKEINFNEDCEPFRKWSKEDFNPEIESLKSIHFSSDYKKMGFFSLTEFKAFLSIKCNSETLLLKIYPVVLDLVNSKNSCPYFYNNCLSPYEENKEE